MELNLDRVRERLQFVENNLERLGWLATHELTDFIRDFRNVETAKYLLQVSIEALLDVCSHVVARWRLGAPADNQETLEVLAKEGLLPEEHLQTYLEMNAFRNRVVHGYMDVDPVRVHDILRDELDDVRQFIADLGAILRAGPSRGLNPG
jgi:uncharacterized protein YutE (UPF0331/DUF86 family)